MIGMKMHIVLGACRGRRRAAAAAVAARAEQARDADDGRHPHAAGTEPAAAGARSTQLGDALKAINAPPRRAGQRHAQGVRRSEAEGRSVRRAICGWCASASTKPTSASRRCRRRSKRCGCRFRSIPPPRRRAARSRSERGADRGAATRACRRRDAAASAPTPAPVGPGHVAAAAVRHRVGRLHRRASGISASAGSTPTCARSRAASWPTKRSSTSASATTPTASIRRRSQAYNQVITNYPRGQSVAAAYYKRGLAFERARAARSRARVVTSR